MLRLRIMTSLIVAPITILIVLMMNSTLFSIGVAALCMLALWEWTRLIGIQNLYRRIGCVVLIAAIFLLLWIYQGSVGWWLVICAGFIWWFVAIFWLQHFSFAVAPTKENKILKLVTGILVVVPAWTALMQLHLVPQQGHGWALFALLLVWMADTSAYFAGRRWGTTKLAPRISPGKTRAGAYGAVAGSILVALIGGWVLNVSGLSALILMLLAVITTVFSIIGDLFESMIKRHSNLKDSGSIFPGHGGVFDRLDSLFAALPIFVIGKTLFDI